MGALAEQGDAEVPTAERGEGKRLVDWWRDVADDDDRDLLRGWVDSNVPHYVIADRLSASGYPISRGTVQVGIRRLRSTEWAT